MNIMQRWLLLIFASMALLGAMSVARAQSTPTPPVSVPTESEIAQDDANLQLKQNLDQRRAALLQMYDNYNQQAAAYNTTYGGLTSDSPEYSAGYAEWSQLSQSLQDYDQQNAAFASDVSNLVLKPAATQISGDTSVVDLSDESLAQADQALMKHQWEMSIDPRYLSDPDVQQNIRDLWTAVHTGDSDQQTEAISKLKGILTDQFKSEGMTSDQINDYFTNLDAFIQPPDQSDPNSNISYYGEKNLMIRQNIDPEQGVMANVSYMGSGRQTTDDCALYAIADEAQVPESQVETDFQGVVKNMAMDPVEERTNPDMATASPKNGGHGGLNGWEEFLVAGQYGKVVAVPPSDFAKTIESTGQPVVTSVIVDRRGDDHAVVVTGVYKATDGKTYYSVMDSNLGAGYKNSTAYVEKSFFESKMSTSGFIIVPKSTP